jgi:hypothetical protein
MLYLILGQRGQDSSSGTSPLGSLCLWLHPTIANGAFSQSMS